MPDDQHVIRFLLAAIVVFACVVAVWWFVFGSGLNAPAGFVYEQY